MSDLLVIGIPKSGNNVTERACKLLGLSPAGHTHTANYHLADTNKVVYVYRNPRNVLISALKYRNHQRRGAEDTITQDKLIDVFYDFFNNSLPSVYTGYMPWMSSKACIVRFEDLLSSKNEMDRIADYMGVQRTSDDAFKRLYGESPTWSGKLSEWKDHWGDSIDNIWNMEGMPEIEKSLGYENKWPVT